MERLKVGVILLIVLVMFGIAGEFDYQEQLAQQSHRHYITVQR